ncbi:MAG: hypothetical protein QM690_21325, partial [Sphingobium sp.]
MASTNAEIIARLRLNGMQFSQENDQLWARFEEGAKKSGSMVKTSIQSALSEVQAAAKSALTLPTTDLGAINLGTDALRKRTEAARNEAVALREVATAAERAANAQDGASDEARAYAVASALLAQKAEENAAALGRQANALEMVQRELDQAGGSTARFANDNDKLRQTSGAMRAGLQNAGFQVQDFLVQVNGGTDALRAFSMQAPQFIGSAHRSRRRRGCRRRP